MVAIVFILVSTVSAGFAALTAQARGREPPWFAVGGLLLGVFGVLIAAGAKTSEARCPRPARGPSPGSRWWWSVSVAR
jgi:hypothetical protein